jgi:hypothetical protein
LEQVYAVRSFISNGCAVWLPSGAANPSAEAIENCQYKMAKLILNTKLLVPKVLFSVDCDGNLLMLLWTDKEFDTLHG